jgi:hypothetical protein
VIRSKMPRLPEMPRLRLEDSQELLHHAGEEVGKGAKKMW